MEHPRVTREILIACIALLASAVAAACGDDASGDDAGSPPAPPNAAGTGGSSTPSNASGTGGSSAAALDGGASTSSDAGGSSGSNDAGAAAAGSGGALEGSCPAGFVPVAGVNEGFTSDADQRVFHARLPDALDTPRPVFVALTGTVQPETDFLSQSGLDQLTESGWIVLAPVRECSAAGTNCNTTGSDGRVWEPWFDGTLPASDDAGKDVRFVEAMVRCAADAWPVDADRIYVGGISAGGSFTNRNLTFNSDFFAGGVVSSGNWYGGGAAPMTPMPMQASIVIVVWGGPDDKWPVQNPIADYSPETRSEAMFYAMQEEVVTLACSGMHGHVWPTAMTPWLAETLLAHPKGSAPEDFVLAQPPAGLSCVRGAYTDH